METYVGLLRGVNVGGKGLVPMAELRSLLSSLGHSDVVTYIQSGNVVFASERPPWELATELEEAVVRHFGVRTFVLLRTRAELGATVGGNPFPDTSRLYVAFLAEEPSPAAVAALEPGRSPPDELVLRSREAYLWLPNGAGRTKLTIDWLERTLSTKATMRNWRTVTKLLELAGG